MPKKKYYHLDDIRFRYLTKVYGYATLAYLATIFQWILVREIKPILYWFDKHPMMEIFFWLPALIIIFCVTHFNGIRHKFIVNWVIFGTAVEILTIGIAFSLSRATELMFIVIFFIMAFIIISAVIIGHYVKMDLTKSSIIVFGVMIFLYLAVIIFIILNVIYETIIWIKIAFGGTSLVLVILAQLYIVQISHGGRYIELRPSELILPVAVTYMDAIIGFILIYMVIETIVIAVA